MSDKPRITEEDLALFRDAVGEVRPVRNDRHDSRPRPPGARPRQREADERAVIGELLSEAIDPAELDTGEHLTFARPGVQQSVLRKLRRGAYAIQAELDLHGLNAGEAASEVPLFLQAAREHDQRCVCIIHGKGRKRVERAPVLKPLLNHWLQQRREVLAFCSARPEDGGTGAVYVLLKKR